MLCGFEKNIYINGNLLYGMVWICWVRYVYMIALYPHYLEKKKKGSAPNSLPTLPRARVFVITLVCSVDTVT